MVIRSESSPVAHFVKSSHSHLNLSAWEPCNCEVASMHRGVEMPDEQALSKTAIIIDWKPPEISYSWVSFLVGSHLKYDTSVSSGEQLVTVPQKVIVLSRCFTAIL